MVELLAEQPGDWPDSNLHSSMMLSVELLSQSLPLNLTRVVVRIQCEQSWDSEMLRTLFFSSSEPVQTPEYLAGRWGSWLKPSHCPLVFPAFSLLSSGPKCRVWDLIGEEGEKSAQASACNTSPPTPQKTFISDQVPNAAFSESRFISTESLKIQLRQSQPSPSWQVTSSSVALPARWCTDRWMD